ncbi:MAG: PEGA domain-containing protein [Bacillota bacterium]
MYNLGTDRPGAAWPRVAWTGALLAVGLVFLRYALVYGAVIIHSQPVGVRVTFDGREVGRTPVMVKAQAGTYQVELSQADRTGWSGTVTVEGGRVQELVVDLEPGHGHLELDSVPGGARVYRDGQLLGVTPLEVKDLPAGHHELVITSEGHGSRILQVWIWSGQIHYAQAVLPLGAWGRLLVSGEVAAITVNGTGVGASPLHLDRLSGGIHTLGATLPSGEFLTRKVLIAPYRAGLGPESDLAIWELPGPAGVSVTSFALPAPGKPAGWTAEGELLVAGEAPYYLHLESLETRPAPGVTGAWPVPGRGTVWATGDGLHASWRRAVLLSGAGWQWAGLSGDGTEGLVVREVGGGRLEWVVVDLTREGARAVTWPARLKLWASAGGEVLLEDEHGLYAVSWPGPALEPVSRDLDWQPVGSGLLAWRRGDLAALPLGQVLVESREMPLAAARHGERLAYVVSHGASWRVLVQGAGGLEVDRSGPGQDRGRPTLSWAPGGRSLVLVTAAGVLWVFHWH